MDEKFLTAIILAVFVVVLFTVMGRSWLRRTARDEDRITLPEIPAGVEDWEPVAVVDGMYVATTVRGQHFERLMAHELGVRTNARVFVYDRGVLFERHGTEPIWCAADAVEKVGTASGMVGKFVEKDGLVLLSWRLAAQEVDTGFRPRSRDGKKELLTALSSLEGTVQYRGPSDAGPTDSGSTHPGPQTPAS